ncbi:unnamed protein product [Symbiodinium sp. CCMP2456]|nr:unnamed protein product [Symbiodinium sp. CCMP2456]
MADSSDEEDGWNQSTQIGLQDLLNGSAREKPLLISGVDGLVFASEKVVHAESTKLRTFTVIGMGGQLKKRNGLVITMADSTGLSEKRALCARSGVSK